MYLKQHGGIWNTPSFNHRNLLFRNPLWRLVFIDLRQGTVHADTTKVSSEKHSFKQSWERSFLPEFLIISSLTLLLTLGKVFAILVRHYESRIFQSAGLKIRAPSITLNPYTLGLCLLVSSFWLNSHITPFTRGKSCIRDSCTSPERQVVPLLERLVFNGQEKPGCVKGNVMPFWGEYYLRYKIIQSRSTLIIFKAVL